MDDLTWLIRQIPFIFFSQFSFSWGKWNIYFSWYFLQPFSPVIFEFFNPELVKEFCKNNQNWPKTVFYVISMMTVTIMKKQKIKKLGWECLKTCVGIFQVWIFRVGNFRLGIFQGRVWWVGIFRVGLFLIPFR